MVGTRQNLPSWMSVAASRVDFDANVSSSENIMCKDEKPEDSTTIVAAATPVPDVKLGFGERAISAVLVNPLDVAKIDETTTLKDLDLNFIFRLQRNWYEELMKKVDRDCEFLEAERIMDYSLLVGLHFRDDNTADKIGLPPFYLRSGFLSK